MKALRLCFVALFLLIVCAGTISAEPAIRPGSYTLGTRIDDFSFNTYDGQSVTLSEVLKEKDMVLINIWASWCGPCRMEFPYMQEAYAQYQDQVEVFALSCETTDTPEKLAQFAAEYGLTFKIGQDPVNFLAALNLNSIPVSLVVDRFGVICYIEAGAQTSTEVFSRLFDVYVGDDYTESVLLQDIPAARPEYEAATDEEISEALGMPAYNLSSANVWPMMTGVKDGRNVVISSNTGCASSTSAVEALVRANAGDAIVITFKTSTEAVFDALRIIVDDEPVKRFAGAHDWMSYAIPVSESGEHQITVAYQKDHVSDGGEDTVWIDSIAVVSDAQSALAMNPVYPVHESISIEITGTDAKQVMIDDPYGALYNTFGAAEYYVVNSSTAEVHVTLTENIDPEEAFLVCSFDGSYTGLSQVIGTDGYRITTNIDSPDTTGYVCTYVMLYENALGQNPSMVVMFRDEKTLSDFVSQNNLGQWEYIESEAADDVTVNPDQATYTIKCVDTEGMPVAGVMLQICDETTCQVVVTDENGSCQMTTAPYAWEVHILKAPAGYSTEGVTDAVMPQNGGDVAFVLKKS